MQLYRLGALGGAIILACAGWAGASQAPEPAPRLERLANGVYAIVHENATEVWPTSNTGVIVGDDGVLVVDAGYLPSIAAADIAVIRTITDKPVKYLLYTHWHFDHNNGGIAYRKAFPDVRVVSERATARYIDINTHWWKAMWTGPGSPALEDLRNLDAQLRSGMGADGRPLDAAALDRLRRDFRQRDREQQELASLEVVVPDQVFDDRLTLMLGSRRVELVNRGPANSPADTTVFVPDAGVLFTGDVVVQSPLPFTRFAWPQPWIGVLKAIEAENPAVLVPGHGPVMHGVEYPRQVRLLLERGAAEVEQDVRQGMTLEQIQSVVTLRDVRAQVPAWRDAPDGAWKAMLDVLLDRLWRGIRGQG
jgi:glyoxylase-like metal-dependent hydrolase (beta-lactamase superfamily II)